MPRIPLPYLVLLVAGIGGLYWISRDGALTDSPPSKRQQRTREEIVADRKATYLKRLQVEERREISPGQTITVLLVPDSNMPQLAALDTRCVIYEHATFRTVKMFCDGEETDDDAPPGLDDVSQERGY